MSCTKPRTSVPLGLSTNLLGTDVDGEMENGCSTTAPVSKSNHFDKTAATVVVPVLVVATAEPDAGCEAVVLESA